MGTPFDIDRAEFSNRAHQAAQRLLYPQIFGIPLTDLEFEEAGTLLDEGERGRVLDGELAIDRVVKVSTLAFDAPLVFPTQERFREPDYYGNLRGRCRDVTITKWNHKTNLPSELHKITADLFLYGFFDEGRCDFLDAIAFWVPPVKFALIHGLVRYSTHYVKKKRQMFIAICFDDLLPYCRWWKGAPEDSDLGNILFLPTDEDVAWQAEQIRLYHEREECKTQRAKDLIRGELPATSF